MVEFLPLILFAAVFVALLAGYSVAATLAGVALLFALVGAAFGIFDLRDLGFLPSRLYGIVTNHTLIAVPLFVLMGVTLERTRIAETLLESLSAVMGGIRGGLGIAVTLVGMLMAASTGIVGATVVTMGLLALPTMLRHGYDPKLATGTICATGTLGQIIPPSIALVLLGDVLSGAYQQAQLSLGAFSPKTVSVGDLFAGALLPGLVLVGLYVVYLAVTALLAPRRAPGKAPERRGRGSLRPLLRGLLPPLILIVAVLGSILGGLATPTEAAGVGAMGAIVLAAAYRSLKVAVCRDICISTVKTTSMVFFILIGASVFSLVFRGYGGDELVQGLFAEMPGGVWGATIIVMLAIFLLGFILDFIEITYVVVPIVAPVLLAMGLDPVWLGVLIAVNLQTSFLTPPFGFALFYLRGVAPAGIATLDIYRGVVPFIVLQVALMLVLVAVPELATWLPGVLY
ncbi:MAG: TRAP transporter large permease subunit [Gammaproteobacteria bacterium]|nr:TRAP transporter large permease subunit [Gammaproteobacteria bacterium]MDE0441378.1 TRAP transporter large permease subunit [Gammaproteobacteria bacterium]